MPWICKASQKVRLRALRGFAVGGAEPPVGAPVCSFGCFFESVDFLCRTDRYRLRAAAPPSPSFVKPQGTASEQIRLTRGMCLVVGFCLSAEAASSACGSPCSPHYARFARPSSPNISTFLKILNSLLIVNS